MIKKTAPLSILFSVFTFASLSFAQDGANGPGIDNSARPAGTLLKFVPLGGRMVTYHRGYLYIMGQGKTTLWDVSNATDPTLISSEDYGDNGHRWWKLDTDIFWREYTTPEIEGSGYRFLDMSNMFDLKPWTDPNVPVPIEDGGNDLLKWQYLETFPTGTNGGNVHDLRYDDPANNIDAITSTFDTSTGAEGGLRFRIGNLMFTTTGTGVAVLDIGDPENVKVLDAYIDPGFKQYTTTYHVWRDKIVFMDGTNGNLNDNNLAMIDFSDPTDLKPFVWPNGRTGLKTEEMSAGRYMYFQDEYGFAGHTDIAIKLNMETGEIVQKFEAPGWPQTYLDYQWMPLGPFVVGTGSNNDDGRTFFYQHQDEPDTRGPEIGFHSPFDESINNPVSTVIGFSIPEIIDERTATDDTIQVRAIGSGTPIEGHITWNSYHVLNFVPKTFLEPDTTYEVRFVEGGLKDVAGNGISEFIFHFSTGNDLNINVAPTIDAVNIVGVDDLNPVLVKTNLLFDVDVTDIEGDEIEYRWDFGEGNSEWSDQSTATASFDDVGIFNINVQARDSQGGIGGATKTVVVVNSADGAQPRNSGLMALLDDGVLVVNPDNDTITLIDTKDMVVENEVDTCSGPVSVALDAYDRAWISCRDSDEIAIHNLETGGIETRIALGYGAQPRGIISSADGEQIYIALSGKGAVLAFDAASLALENTVQLAQYARALALDPSGQNLFVTQFISGDAGLVWQLDTSALELVNTFELENDTSTPDAGNMGSGLPNYLAGLAIDPNGGRAFVVGKKDNTDRGLLFGDEPLTFEFTSRSNISELDLDAGDERQSERIDIDNHAQPSAATFSPYGTHLFVTMQGNNRLMVLNPNDGSEIVRVDTGLAPQDVLIDPETHHVFVKNFMSRDVSVYDASALLTGARNELALLGTVSTVANETLSSQVLAGKQLFYNAADIRMTAEGYLSCATCHDDAGHDGRTWDFTARGEGLRNTIPLNGRAGTAHGRLHWAANFDEIHDFEHDIRNAFNGSGFLTDEQYDATFQTLGASKAGLSPELDALAAYQATLTEFARSPYRKSDGSLTDDGLLGRDVFAAQGCGSCHNGAAFTDSPAGFMHDVGTIKASSGQRLGKVLIGLDTPTLRDLWSTAPYLHDGSAATLADLLSDNEAHFMSGLTVEERRTLESYLLQIDGSTEASETPQAVLSISGIEEGDEIRSESVSLAIETNLTGISMVRYYANGEEVASALEAPYDVVWTPESGGDYRLQVSVLHNDGHTSTLSRDLSVRIGPSGLCTVEYIVQDEWLDGYRVDVVVTNDGPNDIEGFELSWNINDATLAMAWNATYEELDGQVIASNTADMWNGVLAAEGGSASLGFQAHKGASLEMFIPSEMRLNGATCEVVYEF